MEGLEYRHLTCPYCGESIEMTLDPSAGAQCYIEDCSVCCRPIEVSVTRCGSEWDVEVRRDDD